ncbi:hypothetical protein [Shivajiella indica]|uniref:Aminoglycoside phosphotransferase domain-containing protein n=1 Tax=Shivajiella indica TaxID=872115 RepID=A0ABW5B9D2_9BACT
MERIEVNELAKTGLFQGNPIDGGVVETNISWVILSKLFAFKIKRPVKLSFLDYSDLQKRKQNCERELVLNSRYSSIYLEVLPIRYFENSWVIGEGQGKIKDYAVCMKKLRNSKKMDEMLKKDLVQYSDIRNLATVLANFHKKAEKVRKPFDLGQAKNTFNDLESVRKFVQEECGVQTAQKIDSSIVWSNDFLEKHLQRFEKRAADGWARDLHGDLHSGNIFLYKDPIIFDCIEFNDSFRQIDLLYEIGFLCMDLENFGRADLSEEFLSFYSKSLNCFEENEDMELFKYFKALRANVRAKVYFLNAQSDIDPISKNKHLEMAKSYLYQLFDYQS